MRRLVLRRLPRGWTCQVAAAGWTTRPPRALTRLRPPREVCLRNCQVCLPVHITPSFRHLTGPYSHIHTYPQSCRAYREHAHVQQTHA